MVSNVRLEMTEPPTTGSSAGSNRFPGELPKKALLLSACLVLSTFALYWPVVHHEFLVFDDKPYVTDNPHVNTGLSLPNAAWSFTTFREGNWHPVTWLSHMADCQWFALKPGPHHLLNVILHSVNVLLLFLLLWYATGALWRSFLVAVLFAVHPLNVETVAWVAERKSLLSMFFSLLAIAAYCSYTARPGWKRYLAIVATFALALMSKPMPVTLPLLLLLLDYWPLERQADLPARRRWILLSGEKLPLFLMSAASCTVTMIAQRSGGALADSSILPLYMRIQNAFMSYVAYIAKTVWPANLSVFYPHPLKPWPWPDVIAAAVVLLAVTTIALHFQRFRYLAVGWCWFLITLVPVIGIVQVGSQAMADRYAYLPDIGLFIVIAWGLWDLCSRIALPRFVPAMAALGAVLAFAAVTNHYLQFWQNGVTLFTRAETIAQTPDFNIEEALADALQLSGRDTEAYQHYAAVCTMRPSYPLCHYNMATILFNRHQLRDALGQLDIAASFTNNKDLALSCFINSGQILMTLGDYSTAQSRLAAALQIDPGNETALRLQKLALNSSVTH